MSFLKPLFTDKNGNQLSENQQKSLIQDVAKSIGERLNSGIWNTFDNLEWRKLS